MVAGIRTSLTRKAAHMSTAAPKRAWSVTRPQPISRVARDRSAGSPRTWAPCSPRLRTGAAALAGSLLLAGCSTTTSGGGNTGFVATQSGITAIAAAQREAAPSLSGTALDGKPFSLSQYRGDVVVVNVWGSWCTPCRVEGPALQETFQRYQSKGVRFLGINVRDDNAAAQAFEANLGVTYPSLQDPNETLLLQFKSVVPPTSIPSSVVIDRNGKVAVRILGAVTEPQLAQQLDAVVGER